MLNKLWILFAHQTTKGKPDESPAFCFIGNSAQTDNLILRQS